MFAQPTITINEDKIPIYDKPWPKQMLYLENEKFNVNRKKIKKEFGCSTYTYKGRDYRKLMPHEVKQFDAMSKVKVRFGQLFFNGKRVKTNVLWVKDVYAAYYWNGGVIVVARTSQALQAYFRFFEASEEVGFFNLQTNECKFTIPMLYYFPDQYMPDFIVPVTINTTNSDLAFDIRMPDKFDINEDEKFFCAISLTNKSDKPIVLPNLIFDGLGITRCTHYESTGGLSSSWPIKLPDVPIKPGTRVSPLEPGGVREYLISYDVKFFFNSNDRYRVIFYWDAFLNPDDKNEMSRFMCEKWIDVTEYVNTNLVFDVVIPERISFGEIPDITILLTNVTDKPILVPGSFLRGRVNVYSKAWYKLKSYSYPEALDVIPEEYRDIREPSSYEPVLLMPFETRRIPAVLVPGDKRQEKMRPKIQPFPKAPCRYRMEFTWRGLLNPNNLKEESFFRIKKYIEVTNIGPYHFNKSNAELLFDVKIPEIVSVFELPDCAIISLTNVSDKPILIPTSLIEGLGISSIFYPFDKPIEENTNESIDYKYPDIPNPPKNELTLLMPSETREAHFLFDRTLVNSSSGRYRFDFYWYGLLNPKDKYEVSHFTCNENWIEVTK